MYCGLVTALIITVFFILSAVRGPNQTSPPSFDPKEIENLVDGIKSGSSAILDHVGAAEEEQQRHRPYTVENPNAVKVTFALYTNPSCDDSDPSQFRTISMESSVGSV